MSEFASLANATSIISAPVSDAPPNVVDTVLSMGINNVHIAKTDSSTDTNNIIRLILLFFDFLFAIIIILRVVILLRAKFFCNCRKPFAATYM